MTTQNTITQSILDDYFTKSEQRQIKDYVPSLRTPGGFDLLGHLADLYYNIANFTSGELSAFAGNGVVVDSSSAELSVGVTIYNNTGGDLTIGTLVQVSGYNTTNGITVVKADADGAIPATHVVLNNVISNNTLGVVYPFGRAMNQNTNGRTIGDAVYLDSAISGGFTFTAPSGADQLVQQVGTVKVVNETTGEIEFFPGSAEYLKFGSSFLQTASRTRTATIPFRLVAPTGANQGPFTKCVWQCSQALTIVSVKIASDTASTGSDATNNYNFLPRNNTAAANLHIAATTTQGAELSSTTLKSITVSQNLSFAANDVFVITVNIADDGSAGPTNLSGAEMYAVVEYTI